MQVVGCRVLGVGCRVDLGGTVRLLAVLALLAAAVIDLE